MNDEKLIESAKNLRYWLDPSSADEPPNIYPDDVRAVLDRLDDLETLDEERRRSLNEITTSRDELREQHTLRALHEVSCPECGATIRARMSDATPRMMNYFQQAGDTDAHKMVERFVEQARAAGFYVTTPDAMYFDIEFTPRDESGDPKWQWRQHPDTGMVQRMPVQPEYADLHDLACEPDPVTGCVHRPRDPQPEFPDADDESPDRPVYETDPLKE